MSGFEIAGVVLGAFPVLCDSANRARGLYKRLRWWWFFEAEFETFISAVERELIVFSQNLEILLLSLDITSIEREVLQNDPKTTLWHEPRIQKQLKGRLQERYYYWYMGQIHDINGAIAQLLELLPVGEVYHPDSMSLDSELLKLKWSFSRKKERLLATINDRNESIYAFLDRAAHISHVSEPTKTGARVQSFLRVQKQAALLYECFQSQWQCDCESGHSCGIGAPRNAFDDLHPETSSLTILFETGPGYTEVRIEVDDPKHRDTQEKSPNKTLDELKQDLSVKKMHKSIKRNRESFNSNSLVAVPPLLIIDSPSKPDKRLNALERGKRKMKELMSMKEISKPECDTCPTSDLNCSQNPSSGTKVSGVKSEAVRPPEAIKDMCGVAMGKMNRPFHGFMSIGHGTRLLLHLDQAPAGDVDNSVVQTLDGFMAATPRRNQRLTVGLELILSILKLGFSPWLPERWSKEKLLLVKGPDANQPTPYIPHDSVHTTLKGKQTTSHSTQARASLFVIGVLLLELLFRQTMETLPLRSEFLGSSGQPNEMTDLCTALEWQKQVEDEFGDSIAEAIRRCIVCAFDPSPNLGNLDFVQAVCLNVVAPLEEFLSAWKTT